MIKRYLGVFLVFYCCAISNAQSVFRLDSIGKEIALDAHWKYHNGDNMEWANPSVDDRSWDTISLGKLSGSLVFGKFKGMGWFRLHLKVSPALFHKTLLLQVGQSGASEIYLNNTLIQSFGVVGDLQHEIPFDPSNNIYTIQLGGDTMQLLAVRYSQNKAAKIVNSDLVTLNCTITLAPLTQINEIISSSYGTERASILIFAVFLTLSIFHLLLFIFYRKTPSNLYYSIFALLISFCTISPFILSITHNPLLAIYVFYIVGALIAPCFIMIVVVLYSIFGRKYNWWFWTLIGLTILTIMSVVLKMIPLYFILIFTQTSSASISGIVIIIKVLRKKQQGAWIIALGFLVFLCLIPGVIILFAINSMFAHGQGLNVNGAVFIVWIFSIPASMSVYLASDFSRINKKLSLQLVHVKQLSEQNIEKEREKKQIIEEQKEILELQVKEKTSEIQEQKNELMQKNIEITDSIIYARRIQSAILPTEEMLKNALGDYFVIFKPKDVVSGDFYWCHVNGDTVVFAVADCTGHGVPGAFMSMIGNSLLNEVVLDGKTLEADVILNALRNKLIGTLQQSSGHITRDGMDIALCVWNKEDNTLQYAGANIPLYIISENISKADDIQQSNKIKLYSNHLLEIVADKQPIGYQEGKMDIPFTKQVIQLHKGDTIYITSDGYVDQFGGGMNKKFTSKRLRDILDTCVHQTVDEQRMLLVRAIEDWKKNETQTDDICVLGVKIS